MIDLTPLDVRNKRGDFRKGLRGYEPHEVDAFLETVADRMDVLVRENLALRERAEELRTRVERQEARETAVQEALVSAQALREEIREQARREGDLLRRESDEEARRLRAEAQDEAERLQREAERFAEGVRSEVERLAREAQRELEELERSRRRFLKAYRGLLEREMDMVQVEETRTGPADLDLDALRIFEGVGEDRASNDALVAEPHHPDLQAAAPLPADPGAADPDAADRPWVVSAEGVASPGGAAPHPGEDASPPGGEEHHPVRPRFGVDLVAAGPGEEPGEGAPGTEASDRPADGEDSLNEGEAAPDPVEAGETGPDSAEAGEPPRFRPSWEDGDRPPSAEGPP